MENEMLAAEEISLFCRLNMNTRKKFPIRASEMGMLIYLCKTDGCKTPMGVANFFKVTKSMVTNMVSALSKSRYITKEPVPEDRRSSLLIPTKKAVELVESTYEEYYKTIAMLELKMGQENFAMLISLLKQANTYLLEDKKNG